MLQYLGVLSLIVVVIDNSIPTKRTFTMKHLIKSFFHAPGVVFIAAIVAYPTITTIE